MFYVLRILYQHYMYVHLHGAIFLEVFVCLVASSLPVGGSGMLQYGIGALVAAWALIGHEDAVIELML